MAVEQQIAMQTTAPPVAPKPRWSMSLFALCIAFVLVRLPFIFTVPMQEAPDEFAHYWVIRFIKDHARLPNAHEVMAGGPSAVYGSLPQLGYIPHLLMVSLVPQADLSLFERFGSLAMGLVLLYAAYQIGRLLFPRNKLMSFAVPVLVVFHPQLAFVHSYTNNDATSSALAAVILLLTLRSVKDGIKISRAAVMGVLMGWLALSKYSGLAIMPVVALALVAAAVLHKTSVAKFVSAMAVLGGLAAGISLPWFLHNYAEYSGDFLGTNTMYKSWATTFHRDLNYHVSIYRVIKELRWWRMMFFSFWGLFGYMTKYMWRPTYFVYLGFLIASACGGITMLVRSIRQRQQSVGTRAVNAGSESVGAIGATGGPGSVGVPGSIGVVGSTGVSGSIGVPRSTGVPGTRSVVPGYLASFAGEQWQMRVMWASLGLCVLINVSAMLWASTTNLGGPQGRYLFTSEVPVLALLVAGLNQLHQRWGKRLVMGFILFNMIVCFGAWMMLYCAYGFHGHPL